MTSILLKEDEIFDNAVKDKIHNMMMRSVLSKTSEYFDSHKNLTKIEFKKITASAWNETKITLGTK